MAMFTDSIEGNLGIIQELLGGLPPSQRDSAKRAAVIVEKAVMAIQRDMKGSPAAGLGMAYAIYMVAQRLVQSDNAGERESLIQLLS